MPVLDLDKVDLTVEPLESIVAPVPVVVVVDCGDHIHVIVIDG